MPTENEPTAPKRLRRPPLSCVQCRRRRVKCDRSYPCSNCTKSKMETCSYAPSHTPKGSNQTKTKAKKVTSLSNSTDCTLSAVAASHQVCSPGLMLSSSSTVSTLATQHENSSLPISRRLRQDADPSQHAGHSLDYDSADGAGRLPVPPSQDDANPIARVRNNILKGRHFGQSHWMNTVIMVRRSIFCTLKSLY